MKMDVVERLRHMDFGGITPLYVYRMWNDDVPLEEIERAMTEIKFPGR